MLSAPTLKKSPTLEETTRYVQAITQWIGLGFHPDTDMIDYILPNGSRSFAKPQAASLNDDLVRARKVLEQASIDICEVGLPIQHEMLGIIVETSE